MLEAAGFEAYVVGGCVRDAIMGRKPGDWDICTSALPEQTKAVMGAAGVKCADTGIKHGTITVIVDGEAFETTTYRSDGSYSDGRHPDSVEFLTSIEGDLARRDCTVNAMAYNPERGLVDLYGGQDDISAHVLRCVGDPVTRFTEDGLRILRGLRFASVLGFEIDPKTSAAIHDMRELLSSVSVERLWIEFSKLLCGTRCVEVLREFSDVVAMIIPELEPEFGFDQKNPFHVYDVWEHTLHTLQAAPPEMNATVRFALLLHDIGKPSCFFMGDDGVGHAYGHEKAGEGIARAICERLHTPRETRETVAYLVRWHMFSIPETPKAMRRFLVKHGETRTRQLFAVRACDKSGIGRGQMPDAPMSIAFAKAEKLLEEQLAEQPVFGIRDLAINGRDLLELGFPQGPELGRELNRLLEAVVDGELENTREALLVRAADM